MERCLEIYERIKTKGLAAIDEFIADRAAEDLFLDFKRSADNGSGGKLHPSDRKNLAKAISGFGNSEGGVIVWGIDCSADMKDGADVAHTKVPINNPVKFSSLLQGVISGCTVPPHSGVENQVISINENTGFVVTLIPKSNYAPHQMLPDKKYLIRAGSDFIPTPHDVLAGMFGKRPQPHVFQHFICAVPELIDRSLNLSFGIAIHNEGPGIAADVFCTCLIQYLPGDNSSARFERVDQSNWGGSFEFGRQTCLISAPGFRLPPGANAQPVVIHLSLVPPFEGLLKISGTVGASGARQYSFSIECGADIIKKSYDLFVKKTAEKSLNNHEKHDLAKAILQQ